MALHNIMSFLITIIGSCEDIFCSERLEAFASKRFCVAMLESLLLDSIFGLMGVFALFWFMFVIFSVMERCYGIFFASFNVLLCE